MLDTTAFEIQKKLKAAGYKVGIEDQPKVCKQYPRKGEEYSAIVGSAGGMTDVDVNACLAIIRTELLEEHAPYTIETVGNKSRCFPMSSFAAW